MEMEKALYERLCEDVCSVFDDYDLSYAVDGIDALLTKWWLQQVGAHQAAEQAP